ncbi:hypothetical protein DEDE109153_09525 [Deinococcus deserti]|uniref:Phospholipase C/D domain-containing protein n=1 Tax=Deinococcus deserti (strain DSM 17065 / CIP 109153 / LMG 22923 / VCD115) TaxID=546414 RepID=C1D3E0_DEIDV|nr:hypothetical protein [Deinococcus deserti]ACO48019.1 Hypothetical protein, precursor [Deinococcus deserti VCD115]
MTPTSSSRPGRRALLILGAALASSAMAWKPSTHIYFAEQALTDAVSDGRVTICRTNYEAGTIAGDCRDYAVDPEILAALRAAPAQYRAGVLGPDAYPDLLTGQQVIHPDESLPKRPDAPGGANSWLQYLWDSAAAEGGGNRLAIKAFVVGYLTHAAGDMYGHTFVNAYTGGEFALGPNAVRHIVLEGYVAKRTPPPVDAAGRPVNENSVSIDGVSDFIYRRMVDARPGSVLRDQLLTGSGAATSVPRVYSDLRAGLQRDVDEYYRRKADFDRRSADKLAAAARCKPLDFGCSATLLVTQAGVIQAEKAAYMAVNAAPITYKEYWIKDIDDGLRAWPGVSHELARALVYNTGGVDTARAQKVAEQYVYDHLLSMSGAPDAVGGSLGLINSVLSALFPAFIREAVEQMKRDLLNSLLRQAFGLTVEELKAYVTSPEVHFDRVMATPGGQKTTLRQMNRGELRIADDGFANPSARFDYQVFPAGYNTVTISKLVLLPPAEINRLLRDLGATQVLSTPNVMLGFIRSLDGHNEWLNNAPYQLAPAINCGAYIRLFMRQTGEAVRCGSIIQGEPVQKVVPRPVPLVPITPPGR